ncbi:ABC transporter ATP-binding protein [Pimelobacter simplex]|uniref:ABC transporter ATP-binding protein n=1 Tax=Nocardioides simplex TaxID=2045 RepID=UPI001933F145|nr:ATP-binding cassette domain-containing protein [Pimelobacter simplex]
MASANTVQVRHQADAPSGGASGASAKSGAPVLSVSDLVVEFPLADGQVVHAVSGVSLDLADGETVGILGESGSGKSSAARALMQLPPPTAGSVKLQGKELTGRRGAALRTDRARMQMIFQDPISSLNPRRRVKDLVAQGPRTWGRKVSDDDIREVLEAVGLRPEVVWDRRPHELSGGQCQRVSIARALMLDPQVLICDEPVSALDVSVQAQILNLLEDAKKRYNLSVLFIAHDVAVVKNISDRVMVMYLGKVCEVVPSSKLVEEARHPYTQLLLASVPEMHSSSSGAGSGVGGSGPGASGVSDGQGSATSVGSVELPSPINPPSGCRFRTRCPLATDLCAAEAPMLRDLGDGHLLACHHADSRHAGSAGRGEG